MYLLNDIIRLGRFNKKEEVIKYMFDLLKATDEEVIAHVDDLSERLRHVGNLICKEIEGLFTGNRKELSNEIHTEYKDLKNQFKAEYKACQHCDIDDLSMTKKKYFWGIRGAAINGFQSKVNAKCIFHESVSDALYYLEKYFRE